MAIYSRGDSKIKTLSSFLFTLGFLSLFLYPSLPLSHFFSNIFLFPYFFSHFFPPLSGRALDSNKIALLK